MVQKMTQIRVCQRFGILSTPNLFHFNMLCFLDVLVAIKKIYAFDAKT